MNRKKKIILGATVTVGVIAAGGFAFAALGGYITGTNYNLGTATGSSSPCQNSPMTFDFAAPVWDQQAVAFTVASMDYSGITPACLSSGGSVGLSVAVVNGGQTLDFQSFGTSNASGTITFSHPLPADDVKGASVEYAVKNP